MDEVEFPDGLTSDALSHRWPFNATKQEMVMGGPLWTGGPWTAEDGRRAERLLIGWRAYSRSNGYSLWLVAPGSEAERKAQDGGYIRMTT